MAGEPTGYPELDDRRSAGERQSDNTDEWWGYMMEGSPAEQIDIPQVPGPIPTPRLPGEDVGPQQPSEPFRPAGAEGYFGPSTTFEEMVRPGPGAEAPPAAVELTDDQAAAVMARLQEAGYPEEMWVEVLREAEYTDLEIQRILGR